MTSEEKIVDAIIADLTDRKGLRQEWEAIDEDIKAEIRLKWIELVRKKNPNNQKQVRVQGLREYLKSNGLLWHESHVITDDCMDELEAHVEQLISDTVNKVLDWLESTVPKPIMGAPVGLCETSGEVDTYVDGGNDVRQKYLSAIEQVRKEEMNELNNDLLARVRQYG